MSTPNAKFPIATRDLSSLTISPLECGPGINLFRRSAPSSEGPRRPSPSVPRDGRPASYDPTSPPLSLRAPHLPARVHALLDLFRTHMCMRITRGCGVPAGKIERGKKKERASGPAEIFRPQHRARRSRAVCLAVHNWIRDDFMATSLPHTGLLTRVMNFYGGS